MHMPHSIEHMFDRQELRGHWGKRVTTQDRPGPSGTRAAYCISQRSTRTFCFAELAATESDPA